MREELDAIQRELNHLRGRSQAVELLLTPLLAQAVAERHPADPIAGCGETEREVLASLQNVERSIDSDSDQAWEDMADAVRRIFSNVGKRLVHHHGRG